MSPSNFYLTAEMSEPDGGTLDIIEASSSRSMSSYSPPSFALGGGISVEVEGA